MPLELLYREQHNEVVGGVWLRHHQELADFIARYGCQRVFEIGAAHGILAKNYAERVPGCELALVPDVKHMTFWDGDGALIALEDFLQRHRIQ